jgi:putative chitinase
MSLDMLHRMFARPRGAVVAEGPLAVPVVAVGEAEPDWPRILRAASFAQPEMWARSIAPAAWRRGIHAGRRAAAFAATIAHESAGGTGLVESLNYTPEALLGQWPSRFRRPDADMLGRRSGQEADQRGIAERAYGGRMGNGPEGSGDGWRYRGRGLIQITGRDAYALAAQAAGLPLVASPELAIDPDNAAEIAAWTWAAWKGCNPLADAGQVEAWRRAINGRLNGLADVRARYEAVLRVAG